MTPELIEKVEQYLLGNSSPLLASTYENPEAVMALRSAESIRNRIVHTCGPTFGAISFDGTSVGLGCGRHKPVLVTVIPMRKRDTRGELTNKLMQTYTLPAHIPKACPDCIQEAQEEVNIAYYTRVVTCRIHGTELDHRGVCTKCEVKQVHAALDGRLITLVKAEKYLSHYHCPMHGDFSKGHRAKPVCPVCDSIDGLSQYALSLDTTTNGGYTELARVRELLSKQRWPLPEDPKYRRWIKDLLHRIWTVESFRFIIPTPHLTKGDWLVKMHSPQTKEVTTIDRQTLAATTETKELPAERNHLPSSRYSNMEYLMPPARFTVLPTVALMDEAIVVWSDQWRKKC